MKKKILFALFIAIFTVMALVSVSAEDGDKEIMPGVSGISGYDSIKGYDYLYYGNWQAPDGNTTSGPIKWRVLDDKANTGEEGLFLLSEKLFGWGGEYGNVCFQRKYHYDSEQGNYKGAIHSGANEEYANAYQGSSAQAWCMSFAGINGPKFTAAELAAIKATTKSDKAFISSTYSVPFAASSNILNGDKVFFLSAEEIENSSYGFTNDAARVAEYGTSPGDWWLRSPYADNTSRSGFVNMGGRVNYLLISVDTCAARPAFNLNLDSVLFTSAAVGGKSAAFGGTEIFSNKAYGGKEWKATVIDSTRSAFNVAEASVTAAAGGKIDINYSNAKAGTNEYVSAMIVDNSESVLYYGHIAHNSQSGTAALTVPIGLAAGTYTLNVFSEQLNGDYKTDYASEFKQIILTVDASISIPPQQETTTLVLTIGKREATVLGETVINDVAPIIVNSRTLLPARFVAENLGATVEWSAAERKATISGNGVVIELYIDSTTAYLNGEAVTLDSPAIIRGNRTYTPVRFVAEALGATVEWSAATSQAIITK